MSLDSKKIMARVVYYTLVILTLASSAFFIYALTIRDVAMWAKVIYYIWTGFVIGVTIFDIICTSNREGKFISGIIVYVLSLLAVIMSCILYFVNAGMDGLATDYFNLFLSISMLALMTTGYLIATWCVGERLAYNVSADDEREKDTRNTKNTRQ